MKTLCYLFACSLCSGLMLSLLNQSLITPGSSLTIHVWEALLLRGIVGGLIFAAIHWLLMHVFSSKTDPTSWHPVLLGMVLNLILGIVLFLGFFMTLFVPMVLIHLGHTVAAPAPGFLLYFVHLLGIFAVTGSLGGALWIRLKPSVQIGLWQ